MAESGFFLTGNRPVPCLFCAARNALPYPSISSGAQSRSMPPSYGRPRLCFGLAYPCPASWLRHACGPQRPAIHRYEYKGVFSPLPFALQPRHRRFGLTQGSIAVIPHSGGWPFGALAVWIWLWQGLHRFFQYEHQNPAKCKKLPAGHRLFKSRCSLRGVLVFTGKAPLGRV